MTTASAPGKLILCGEHAVVYGRPAIALPLPDIRAYVEVVADAGNGVIIDAHDMGRCWRVADEPNNPLSELVVAVLEYLAVAPSGLRITISAHIPIASGMGSGAAVATALTRALAAHVGRNLPPATVSAFVYASEQRYHGAPSGIDNTVIAFEQPIWFVRSPTGSPLIEPIAIAAPLVLLIGDTGVRSPTRLPVAEVRRCWQAEPALYNALFDQVGALAVQARANLAQGDNSTLGMLLSRNHALLQQIGVSSPALDSLVAAAQSAGALGAKLSGAGWGGVMLALATPESREHIAAALVAAGAARVHAATVTIHRVAGD